jgi:hypothetical protein
LCDEGTDFCVNSIVIVNICSKIYIFLGDFYKCPPPQKKNSINMLLMDWIEQMQGRVFCLKSFEPSYCDKSINF